MLHPEGESRGFPSFIFDRQGPGWRNRKTRETQNLLGLRARGGSTPPPGTMFLPFLFEAPLTWDADHESIISETSDRAIRATPTARTKATCSENGKRCRRWRSNTSKRLSHATMPHTTLPRKAILVGP